MNGLAVATAAAAMAKCEEVIRVGGGGVGGEYGSGTGSLFERKKE